MFLMTNKIDSLCSELLVSDTESKYVLFFETSCLNIFRLIWGGNPDISIIWQPIAAAVLHCDVSLWCGDKPFPRRMLTRCHAPFPQASVVPSRWQRRRRRREAAELIVHVRSSVMWLFKDLKAGDQERGPRCVCGSPG